MTLILKGKGRAEYTYNGFRNRVGKLEDLSELGRGPDPATGIIPDPVSEVRYTLDMTLPYDNLLVTKGNPGTPDQSFVWGNSLISASGEDKFFYLQDHLGSPIRLMGEGETDTPLAYDEFGVPVVQAGQSDHKSSNPFGFTGYQTDSISGMYFAQARYYQPSVGRFGAQDIVRDGLNWYSYCHSNPIGFVDKNGLWCEPTHEYMTRYAMMGFARDNPDLAWLFDNHTQFIVDGNLRADSRRYGAAYQTINPRNNYEGRHFNRPTPFIPEGVDSREWWAEHHLSHAIVDWNNAIHFYGAGEINITQKNEMLTRALTHLGMGLHSIQDIQGHGNIGVGDRIANHGIGYYRRDGRRVGCGVDSRQFDWVCEDMREVIHSLDQIRFRTSKEDTIDFLMRFYIAIGVFPMSEGGSDCE